MCLGLENIESGERIGGTALSGCRVDPGEPG